MLDSRPNDAIRITFPLSVGTSVTLTDKALVLELLVTAPMGIIEYSRTIRDGAWIRETKGYDVVDLLSGLRPEDEVVAEENDS